MEVYADESLELTAMATVAVNRDLGMFIEVNPDSNHIGNAYFKLYNSSKRSASTAVARISLLTPKYVYHQNTGKMGGKEHWVLDAKSKKELVDWLKSRNRYGNTVWEQIIIDYNFELDGLLEEETKENLLPNLKYPKFLPFNLPMPNYRRYL